MNALLARSRGGAQVEGRTEEGESIAMVLDTLQVHDPKRDEADPLDRDSFRLNALLVSAAAKSKSGMRQPSFAAMPLEAEPPGGDEEAAWFSEATFSGREATVLPPRHSNPPMCDAVWRPITAVHKYLPEAVP